MPPSDTFRLKKEYRISNIERRISKFGKESSEKNNDFRIPNGEYQKSENQSENKYRISSNGVLNIKTGKEQSKWENEKSDDNKHISIGKY